MTAPKTYSLDRPPETLCLLRLSALGDITHVLPTLRTLQKHWPNTKISWVIGRISGVTGRAGGLVGLVSWLPATRSSARWERTRLTGYTIGIGRASRQILTPRHQQSLDMGQFSPYSSQLNGMPFIGEDSQRICLRRRGTPFRSPAPGVA